MASPIGSADPYEAVHRASREEALVVPGGRGSPKRCDGTSPSLAALPWSPGAALSPEALAHLSGPPKSAANAVASAARATVESGAGLRESLANAHPYSVADTKTFVQAYLAASAQRPSLAALHARAAEDAPDILNDRQALDDDQKLKALERAVYELHTADVLKNLEVRPPHAVLQVAVVNEIAEPAAKLADFAITMVPVAGQAWMLTSALTGREVGGLGRPMEVEERALTAGLALVPAVGEILGAGAKGAAAVAQVARESGKTTAQVLAYMRELTTIGREQKLLTEMMELRNAGAAIGPQHEAALRRTVKQLCRAEGFEWKGEQVVLRKGGILPPLRQPVPAAIETSLTVAQRGILEVYLRKVEGMTFATRKDCAIFYTGKVSGAPAWKAADAAVASSGGKKQVISDVGGAFFNGQKMGIKLPWIAEKLVWTRASAAYAERASGEIQFFGDIAEIKEESIFYETELPRLLKNTQIADASRRELRRIDLELAKRFQK